jgi:hypothetical protein
LANNRTGRPTDAQWAALRPLGTDDIQKLLLAAIEAVLKGEKDIILGTHYLTKFADDFPIGVFLKKEGELDYRRVKANRLMRWLNSNGHTPLTMEHLRVGQIVVTLKEKEFD